MLCEQISMEFYGIVNKPLVLLPLVTSIGHFWIGTLYIFFLLDAFILMYKKEKLGLTINRPI